MDLSRGGLPQSDRRRRVTASIAAAAALSSMPRTARAQAAEIRIGQSIHLSGPLFPTVENVIKGQNLALDEVNRAGGIHGRPVRVISYDDVYDAKRCVENCKKLINEDQVSALFAPGATASVIALLPLISEHRIPLIGTYSGAPIVRTKHHPYFFTTTASYQDEVVQMLRNLVTVQQGRVGLVFQNNAFGQLMSPVLDIAAKESGATLVAKVPLELSGENAVAAAQEMASHKPHAVVFIAFGPSLVQFVRAARAHLGVPVYCISVSNSSPLIKVLGDDARGLAFTQIVPYPWRTSSAITRAFNTEAAAAKVPVSYDALTGYINVRVLLEGLRRSGSRPTRQSIVAGMENMRNVDLGGYRVNYSPTNHHGSKYVDLTIIGPGGRFVR